MDELAPVDVIMVTSSV